MKKLFCRRTLWAAVLVMLLAITMTGSALAAQKLDNDTDLNPSSGYTNLLSAVSYELSGNGEVKVKATLNKAYAGIGRTRWTIYAVEVIGEDTNVIKESFEDQGASTKDPTFSHTFKQNTAAFIGAYTDITERQHWQNTDDEAELIANGLAVAIPGVPADPKSQAKTYKSTDNSETYTVREKVDKSFYIRLECVKDTYFVMNDYFSTAEYEQYMLLSKEGETDETRVSKGTVRYLEKGVWYLKSTSSGATISLSFTMRHHVHASGISWTVDGKALKNGLVELSKGMNVTIKATLEPANTDAILTKTGLDNKNRGYGQIYDETVSADGKSLTFKYLCNDQNGSDTVTVVAYDIGYLNDGWTKYELPLGVKPAAPELLDSMVTSTEKSIELNCKNESDTRTYLRVEVKNGKKWTKKLDEKVLQGNSPVHYLKGLKPNTTYNIRVMYYTKNGDTEVASDYKTLKIKTGWKSAPKIKSVKVSNVKSKKTWVEGHWVHGTSYDVWEKGHYDKYTTFNLNVTLSEGLPSGVIGLSMTNDGDVNGKPQFVKGKKGQTSFTFSGSAAGKSVKVSFCFYSDAKYKGYSPSTKSQTVKVK